MLALYLPKLRTKHNAGGFNVVEWLGKHVLDTKVYYQTRYINGRS